jgi:eukaryotic-like serine/threonine-protein kinase
LCRLVSGRRLLTGRKGRTCQDWRVYSALPGYPRDMGRLVQPDRVLVGRYRLITPLGSGGMGTVWLARDELLDRQVGVKEVRPPAGVTERERGMLRERTLREARIAARLRHPNVVAVHDVIEDGDQPWIVMELGPARSLRDVIQQGGPLTPQQAAQIGLQVLAALRAAHAIGIMHRDVKPDNVLLDTDGRAVLADFGIAHAQDSPILTASGVILGSPSYIAPERARGERGGRESDLWSLGATLYSAVEGRPPYDRPGALVTAMAAAREDPDPPRRAGLLWPVISGLLRNDPGQRLEAAAVEQMLHRVLAADDTLRTAAPLLLSAGPADLSRGEDSATEPPRERLRRPERTHAFDPLVTARVVRLPTNQPSPPAGSATPAAAVPAGPVPDSGSPAGCGSALTQPLRGEDSQMTELLAGLMPAREAASSSVPGHLHLRPFPQRSTWLITAAAAALIVAAGVLIRPSVAGHHAARPSQPAVTSPASAPTGTGHAAKVPRGFHTYADPTGFSIAVPIDWKVSRQGGYVYIRDPAGARSLVIGQTDHPKPGQLADWRRQETSRIRTYPGYHRIFQAAVSYPPAERAADWEFTYNGQTRRIYVLNRDILANSGHAYAFYWSTPASEWKPSRRLFRVFARTFRPAPA